MSNASQSSRTLIAMVPNEYLKRDTLRAFAFLARDLALFVGCGALILMSHWTIALVLSLVMGSVLVGIFVIGHDCGHRSFSNNTKINDWVGEIATGLALWPFHVWRLSHDIHHRHTHNIEKDIAWVPFTESKLRRLSSLQSAIYRHTRGGLFFTGSLFFTYYFIKDALRGKKSRHFTPEQMPIVQKSLLITLLCFLAYAGLSVYLGGLFGFVFLFLIPQLVYQFHLSTYTLFHHTHPDSPFLAAEEWSYEKGQLHSTIHVSYPRALEWLNHDINWHVPHHVCVGIPHYHLRGAHQALVKKIPQIKQERFSWPLIHKVITRCQYINNKHDSLAWQSASQGSAHGAASFAKD
jgi:omega-6 fatty acid desaturase (delta-12 desaturase)